jgi:site-specific DNA recombinase
MRFVRDPTTGKRVSRANPASAWPRTEVPALRIIDDDLWQRVQQRLAVTRVKAGADNPDRPRYWEERRAVHLLTHKVFCGACGGAMSNVGRDYLGCGAARKQGVCTNTRGIRRSELDELVLATLRSQVMAPELVEEFVSAFTAEWNRTVVAASAGRDATVRELGIVERKLNGLIDALADGFRSKRPACAV